MWISGEEIACQEWVWLSHVISSRFFYSHLSAKSIFRPCEWNLCWGNDFNGYTAALYLLLTLFSFSRCWVPLRQSTIDLFYPAASHLVFLHLRTLWLQSILLLDQWWQKCIVDVRPLTVDHHCFGSTVIKNNFQSLPSFHDLPDKKALGCHSDSN